MHDSQLVHILDTVEHLNCEEPTDIFAHGGHKLTQVEEKATLDELHHDVDDVSDNATTGFKNLTRLTEF